MTWLDLDDGTRLRVSDRRPGVETGPTVVLVHGWKQSHRLFDRVALELVESGHRVVAYDQRGMGESDKPDGDYDFATLASDLGAVVGATGVQDATLVGWSLGCSVSIEYLRRSGAGVARVVLHNGPVRLTESPEFPHAMSDAQLDAYFVGLAESWPASEPGFLRESLLEPVVPAVLELLTQVALQTPLDVALKVVRQQARLDHRSAVAELTVPVLAIYSEHDPYYPASLGEWIAATSPDGRALTLHHSAHCAALEEPSALAEAISTFR